MIRFGTDGWRGIIAEDYTFHNVRLVSHAIADYVKGRNETKKGIVIGYDARFLSDRFAKECASVLQADGVKAWISDSILPTPALSWQVKDRQAAGGVMITASHNPPEYNGLKFKAVYGGSASPEIVHDIESYVIQLEEQGRSFNEPQRAVEVAAFNAKGSYLGHVKDMLNTELLSSYKHPIVFDMMHGASCGYPSSLAEQYGLNLTELRNDFNPSFGGIGPEPIERNLGVLKDRVREMGAAIGLATDGDGDRIGAVDADGRYLNAHQIMAILIKYLVEKRGMSGGVVQTLTVSELIRGVAGKYGLKLYEMPVGFKYVTELMLTEDILIGGEEAGGIGIKGYIPERDGLLLGFLLIEAAAAYGTTLGQLIDSLMDEVGHYYYGREDMHLTETAKQELLEHLEQQPPRKLGKFEVLEVVHKDGFKLKLSNAWVIFRVSGTEPIVRIYSEANDLTYLREILEYAQQFAKGKII